MKLKHCIVGVPLGLLVLGILLAFFEITCAVPHYELEPATIVSVGPDASGLGGFPGEKERTLIKYSDGLTQFVGGNRGAPGDKIAAYRQRGIDTPFGWLSHR